MDTDKIFEKLKYSKHLEPFKDVINKEFSEIDKELLVYRTITKDSPCEWDQTPHAFRPSPDGTPRVARFYTAEEVEKKTERWKYNQVSQMSLSVNRSREEAEKSYFDTLQGKIDKGADEEEIEALKKARGENIGLFRIPPGKGLITEFNEKGHAEYLQFHHEEFNKFHENTYVITPPKDDTENT